MHAIRHDFDEESLVAKVEWFTQKTPLERYDAMLNILEMLQKFRPDVGQQDQDDDRWPSATVRVLTAAHH